MMEQYKLSDFIYSDENIFLAIYSVRTYVFDPQLLSSEDRRLLEELKDIFDEEKIASLIVKVRTLMHKVLDGDENFKIQVYFKPKKINDGELEFRPIHTADLVTLIAMVAMLHVLIYELPNKKTGKFVLSNYSKLMPDNFYGNRVSKKPEELFYRWNEQYKKYTQKANEYFNTFHKTGEYLYEVKLDIKKFFPSVNPVILFQYLIDRKPVTLKDEEKHLFEKIIEKLLINEITNLDTIAAINMYYDQKIDKTDRIVYTRGIAQGLPQSYFFGNIYMIEISKIYEEEFKGKGVFYVDDSYLYTNEIIGEKKEFQKKIECVNSKIKETYDGYLEKIDKNQFSSNMRDYDMFCSSMKEKLYELQVYEEGKSSCSDMKTAKESEIYLKALSREASVVGADMFATYSDEEDATLLNRTRAIYQAIEKELEKEEKEEVNRNDNYIEKLHRYYKFFKYRTQRLELKEKPESKLEQLKVLTGNEKITTIEEGYNELKQGLMMEEFIPLYKDDIWTIAVTMLIENETCEKKMEEIRDYIKRIIEKLYGSDLCNCAYLKQYYDSFLKNEKEMKRTDAYTSLTYITRRKLRKYSGMYQDILCEELETWYEKMNNTDTLLNVLDLCSEDYCKWTRLVTANSTELQRKLLNAMYSYVFRIQLSDDMFLNSYDRKSIDYGTLRTLVYLRNKSCNLNKFFQKKIQFSDRDNKRTIDYSIFEVLEIFENYVLDPEKIDELILVHQYTCDVWKNGSKHLYFYTMHNQEHAVTLIKNIVKILKVLSYIRISRYDYYLLFCACYLHDISMVRIPDKQTFLLEEDKSKEVVADIEEKWDLANDLNTKKQVILNAYEKIDAFWENAVRNNHGADSAREIRKQENLKFLSPAVREMIATISEAHASDIRDIYHSKGDAKEKMVSYKFDKILIRLADLLDMSAYRVSKPILNHNIENMPKVSAFHWISHLLTEGYTLIAEYLQEGDKGEFENIEGYLNPGSMTEEIQLTVHVGMSQMSEFNGKKPCKYAKLCSETLSPNGFQLIFDDACDGSNCNFLCRWFSKKNDYLTQEMYALEKYLNRIPQEERFYNSRIVINVQVTESTNLDDIQFEVIKKQLD